MASWPILDLVLHSAGAGCHCRFSCRRGVQVRPRHVLLDSCLVKSPASPSHWWLLLCEVLCCTCCMCPGIIMLAHLELLVSLQLQDYNRLRSITNVSLRIDKSSKNIQRWAEVKTDAAPHMDTVAAESVVLDDQLSARRSPRLRHSRLRPSWWYKLKRLLSENKTTCHWILVTGKCCLVHERRHWRHWAVRSKMA